MKKGILVHFGELSTKGKNRDDFIARLSENIVHALKGLTLEVRRDRDHIRIYVGEDREAALKRLLDVPGINRLSYFLECERELSSIEEAALAAYEEEKSSTFKIETSRPDKSFPLDSYAVSREVGGFLLRKVPGLRVDVHDPELRIKIIVARARAYVYAKTFQGAGGYPLGSLGKAIMLMSGGIDSPVASYLLLRRGIALEFIHFAAPPYTSEEAVEKVKDLLRVLSAYQAKAKLHVVNFTKLQLAIYEKAGDPYAITIMRRMMLRIAERLARRRKCLAIATGESIGQVASQTLQSLLAINEVTSYPIVRPLAAMDKTMTIELARKIATYDISIRPHEDCCTIFTPRHPVTRPKLEECLKIESSFDYEPLIEAALMDISTVTIGEED